LRHRAYGFFVEKFLATENSEEKTKLDRGKTYFSGEVPEVAVKRTILDPVDPAKRKLELFTAS